MNRKPIFDAVRIMLGRGFSPAEVKALDEACNLAEAAIAAAPPQAPPPPAPAASGGHQLGALSEVFESGNSGPGTVSSGSGDPGGVSYGIYQLSSKAGTLTAFMKAEGKPLAPEFGAAAPGSAEFSRIWKAIAQREPDKFRAAQHLFIERTHYRPVVAAVLARKGLDLDSRHDAVRDATFSVAVQHGGAAGILITAIDATDPSMGRDQPGYDRELIQSIYKARTEFVLRVAANPKLPKSQRDQLVSITKNRYPAELAAALKMIDNAPVGAAAPASAPVAPKADGTIDGNEVARQHGVDVKSAAVKISRLHPAMAPVIAAVAEAVKTLGLPKGVITSGNDSNHMQGSLHFQGRALDFRANNLQLSVGEAFRAEVARIVGKDYDAIFETFMDASNNHLHVEFDPK